MKGYIIRITQNEYGCKIMLLLEAYKIQEVS